MKEVKSTKTFEAIDSTAALVVKAVHAAFTPLEKWVLQREYNLEETKKLLEEKLRGVSPEKNQYAAALYSGTGAAIDSLLYGRSDFA